MKLLAALRAAAALTLGAGCTRDGPTAPVLDEGPPPAAVPPVTVPANLFEDFGLAVEDVAARLLPALEAPAGAAQLQSALRDLAGHLANGERGGAEDALARAQGLLARGGSAPGDAADHDAIRLVLDRAAALLAREET